VVLEKKGRHFRLDDYKQKQVSMKGQGLLRVYEKIHALEIED
jgi:hypothetical protein